MASYISTVMIKYIMDKFHNMTYEEAINYVRQLYELYNFLNNAQNNDTTIHDFFIKNNINKENLLQNLNKNNVIAIYNSLSNTQKQQMKQFTSLIQILLKDPNFDFNNPDNNNPDNNPFGGRSRKRRRSKKRKSKRRSSKRRISRK